MPAAPVRDQTGAASLFLCQFCLQQNANLDSLNESSPLMIPAKPARRIDNPIYLPRFHAVHQAVELIEVLLYLLVIIWIAFVSHYVNSSKIYCDYKKHCIGFLLVSGTESASKIEDCVVVVQR